MITFLQSLPRRSKQAVLVGVDVGFLFLSLWGSMALRHDQWWPAEFAANLEIVPLAIILSLPIFIRFGLYRAVIRYLGFHAVFSILKAVWLSVLLTALVASFPQGKEALPPAFWILDGMLLGFCIGSSRGLARFLLHRRGLGVRGVEQVAIYGAGSAGVQLAIALKHSVEFQPLVFVDDKEELQGREILGLRVFAPKEIPVLIDRFGISRILLALPSVSRSRRQEIFAMLEKFSAQVMVMPGLPELASGRKRIDEVRDIEIVDLLGREPIPPIMELVEACIRGKSVMVSGAGGSIGSELCRQIIQYGPTRLVLVERTEFALYSIEMELRQQLNLMQSPIELVPILGSTQHRHRMQSVIQTFGVQTVYHAAAYKHVPIVERNPIEGVQNNIFGTYFLAEAAITAGVETFVLISTDKAVRPTNVMGATKRFAEIVLQALAREQSQTRFIMVRFGNVLASSGSVVPLFGEQIRRGGPVTVTHPEVVRYFMTIPEAAQLVIQAGAMGSGGDVFVLDMGEPVKILDLAKRMIQLTGFSLRDELNPDGDIAIAFTGLREGEKLYEELLIGDNPRSTRHPMIIQAEEESLDWVRVQHYLEEFNRCSKDFDYLGIRELLVEAVRGYQPSGGIKDWVWIRKSR
ncbi:MAG: polysaccharide biosynthesis protein [Magnetococcales bacterium]|nr:polysaccharide biosynthesis protein [Magnetococcales bacterium]